MPSFVEFLAMDYDQTQLKQQPCVWTATNVCLRGTVRKQLGMELRPVDVHVKILHCKKRRTLSGWFCGAAIRSTCVDFMILVCSLKVRPTSLDVLLHANLLVVGSTVFDCGWGLENFVLPAKKQHAFAWFGSIYIGDWGPICEWWTGWCKISRAVFQLEFVWFNSIFAVLRLEAWHRPDCHFFEPEIRGRHARLPNHLGFLDGENQFFKTLRDGCFAVVKYKSALWNTDVCKFCCDLPHQNQDWQLGPLPFCLTWPSVTRCSRLCKVTIRVIVLKHVETLMVSE